MTATLLLARPMAANTLARGGFGAHLLSRESIRTIESDAFSSTPGLNCEAMGSIKQNRRISHGSGGTRRFRSAVSPWLQGRSFESWREQFDTNGFLIFERVLTPETVAAIRAALAPHLARDLKGRNDFEGLSTNRVYALLAKSPVFAELVTHPLALAFVEAELGTSCLLSACLAINLQPGETVQAWHTDDGGARLPRPRPALGHQHLLGDRRHHGDRTAAPRSCPAAICGTSAASQARRHRRCSTRNRRSTRITIPVNAPMR